MKRASVCLLLLIAAAGYVLLQTQPPAPKLTAIMPAGALLYLETPDFNHLLRDWDTSKVKADWLTSANYEVFARSNLFTKLAGVYKEYGAAAGFLPGLRGVAEIAGTDSALALYGIHHVEFLYITRIADADLMKSQLWAVRDKFQQREAGGVSFYLRTDAASQRTVAFAFTRGYLLLATRDDLVGQSLELLAGVTHPNLASDRGYRAAVAAAGHPGELRLVMNLESLVKSDYFGSYWVPRNVSQIRRYWSGIADLNRTDQAITETRVFLRTPRAAENALSADRSVSGLLALVPAGAGLYKASRVSDSSSAAALIVQKLIAPETQINRDERYAPPEASPDNPAGTESDLETRIDEQPLPAGAGVADSLAAVRALTDNAAGHSLLLVQSSTPASATFIRTPAVIVVDGAQDWDRNLVAGALSTAAGKLWTTSQLGAAWVSDSTGRYPSERLDGLGTLAFAIRGRLLIVGNDLPLFAAVLGRTAAALPSGNLTYAAGFRHLREVPDFARIMTALDFTAATRSEGGEPQPPPFFSANLASLSRALSGIAEIRVTGEERAATTRESVTYSLNQ